ncbi:hypothetical protein P7F88_22285 [Vibrio hannami]|uniref:hypothetical protein n=1 Tax=Vibrio hannami TaxID=2717094 RepID=UPI00240E9F3D|nr:hypothetical protein [Vibrio hannami]MDG3088640.1 hypothetical protein [Vibrio hannami]
MNNKLLLAALTIIPKRFQIKALSKSIQFLFKDELKQIESGSISLYLKDIDKSWTVELFPEQKGKQSVIKVNTSFESVVRMQRKAELIRALENGELEISTSVQDREVLVSALYALEQAKIEALIDKCYSFLHIKRPPRLDIYKVVPEDIKDDLDIDFLRDEALRMEASDKTLALRLMELALEARPNGPLIRKKVLQYRAELAEV